MDGSTGSTNAPQRKRRRPPLACERCRQQKIKCDRELPCNQCVQAAKAPCTYKPDDRLPARSRVSNLDTRGVRIGSLASTTLPSPPAGTGTSSSTSRVADPFELWNHVPPTAPFAPPPGWAAESTASPRHSQPAQDQDAGQEVSGLKAITDRLHVIEKRLSETSAVHADTTDAPLDTLGKFSTAGIFSKTRLFGQSNWRNSIDQVRNQSLLLHACSHNIRSLKRLLESTIALSRTKPRRSRHCLIAARSLRDRLKLVHHRLLYPLPPISERLSR